MFEAMDTSNKEFFIDCINHGINLVDEESGEAFIPFLKTKSATNSDATHVLMATDIQASFSSADQILSQNKDDSHTYGLIWDGYITIDEKKTDCLFIEIGGEEKEGLIFAQRYFINDEKKVTREGDPIFCQKTKNRFHAEERVGPFLREEWNKLVGSPIATFLMIAAADGTIDDKEKKEFVKIMIEQKEIGSQTMKAVLNAAAEDVDTLMGYYSDSALNLPEQISAAGNIISQYAQDGGVQFRKDLYSIAKRIASSSGGFLGIGSIGKEERKTLSFLENLLLSEQA